MAESSEKTSGDFGIEITHIVDRRKGKLQGERREAIREVLLLLLGVELILMGGARALRNDLVHNVRI
jgi:hypothetical protein